MKAYIIIIIFALFLASVAQASIKVALVGDFPGGKGPEIDVSMLAINHNSGDLLKGIKGLQLEPVDDGGTNTGAAVAAQKVIEDSDIKAVVVHGEASAHPDILSKFREADLAVILASSWSTDRGEDGQGATWLSPTQEQLARIAARYAFKGRKLKQVAVLDNSSATSVAAAAAFVERFKSLGGKVVFQGEWQGSHWGMTRTVRALKANWPQAVFVPLEPEASGRLVKLMKQSGMDACILIGGPRLFEQDFFTQGRTHTRGSAGVTAMPDYRGRAILRKHTGLSYSKNSAHWNAYYNFAWKSPHRWTSMVFDGVTLAIRAMRKASGDNDDEDEVPEKRAPEDVLENDGDGPAPAVVDAVGASPTVVVESGSELPNRKKWNASRRQIRQALNEIEGYSGIRGRVKFDEKREPRGAKGMVFQALPKVNSKWMQWWDYKFGPPF